MRSISLTLVAGATLLAATFPAMAQNAAAGAADGAAAGGSVAGPVGAVVGGVTGAAVGTAEGVTGAVLGAPARVVEPAPTTVRRSTCVTQPDGSQRCDSVETTN